MNKESARTEKSTLRPGEGEEARTTAKGLEKKLGSSLGSADKVSHSAPLFPARGQIVPPQVPIQQLLVLLRIFN